MLILARIIKQAVAAHKEGRLEDAERLYRSLLEVQPTDFVVNVIKYCLL